MTNETSKVRIRQLPTGVPGLDAVLGGGLPEYSFNVIAGAPGSGKTTLAQQVLFANATPEVPGIFFTVLGEPSLKVLRYQQQFDFFDGSKIGNAIHFVNLSMEVMDQDLDAVLERIVREVESVTPGTVVVDSFRNIIRKGSSSERSDVEMQNFVQRLALFLTSWQATTFLVGEYMPDEMRNNALFTVADGLFWLSQNIERNAMERKLQIMKLRGQESVSGLHTFRISAEGVRIFPRNAGLTKKKVPTMPARRLSTGIPKFDTMLGGGIPAGDSVLVTGASGSGKSTLCTQFIADGIKNDETGVIVVFEEQPQQYVHRATEMGLDMQAMIDQNKIKVIYLRPLDLSVDETLFAVGEAVTEIGATRVVIDSLSGFEIALTPSARDDFRESVYRMVFALTAIGVTIVNTVEMGSILTDVRLATHDISFLTDVIILQRYVELEGRLERITAVVKTRHGNHSKELRRYEVTKKGIVIGDTLHDYSGILTGFPKSRA
ncbi:MAG: AAA family ATPase, partial [Akkermansiaceae bacterium]|nr:AAA family ATPase [Armatimonadota bacterium]